MNLSVTLTTHSPNHSCANSFSRYN